MTKPARHLPSVYRSLAAVACIGLVSGVLVIGTQPVAVGAVAEGWDKLAHLGLHGTLAALVLWALGPGVSLRRSLWVLLGCAAFGAVDEMLQSTLPGRNASLLDFAADVAGAATVVLAAMAWQQGRGRLRTAQRVAGFGAAVVSGVGTSRRASKS